MATAVHCDEAALVAAARSGDDAAFRRLTDPYVRELRVHCYRMLGSLHDAEDLLQETLLRAWQKLETFEGRAPVRVWLYRIATNACLNARRGRRLPPRLYAPAADPSAEHVPYAAEVLHLQPFPDTLADPEERYLAREGIELAFITAIQLLPPRQRAVLVLREVLGWSAAEVGDLLDTSVPAVNSALQRARRTLGREAPPGPDAVGSARREAEAALLERYMRAWEDADMGALAALLAEDAVLTMPPAPSWYSGRAAIVEFFATSPFVFGDEARRIRLVPTRANGQPAFAAYAGDRDSDVLEATGSWCSASRRAPSPRSPASVIRACPRPSACPRRSHARRPSEDTPSVERTAAIVATTRVACHERVCPAGAARRSSVRGPRCSRIRASRAGLPR